MKATYFLTVFCQMFSDTYSDPDLYFGIWNLPDFIGVVCWFIYFLLVLPGAFYWTYFYKTSWEDRPPKIK